jgi:hypothetical protein
MSFAVEAAVVVVAPVLVAAFAFTVEPVAGRRLCATVLAAAWLFMMLGDMMLTWGLLSSAFLLRLK